MSDFREEIARDIWGRLDIRPSLAYPIADKIMVKIDEQYISKDKVRKALEVREDNSINDGHVACNPICHNAGKNDARQDLMKDLELEL